MKKLIGSQKNRTAADNMFKIVTKFKLDREKQLSEDNIDATYLDKEQRERLQQIK
jgi:hypothetical protein